ncbi:MAG: stage 0 sporulation family protein [Oscillospiraceae bacterium]|nr:stage 0 sporulation family protein [Oscillospiraceae bacterium]
MTEIVSIKFRNRGKLYFFSPGGLTLQAGDSVIVETAKGLEMGNVLQGNHTIPNERVVAPLRPVVRVATENDKRIETLCRQREKEAFGICRQRIAAHGLDMKLVDVECSFEGNKIIFFFSSDGRVDFRELVKDLASVFRTRIELRQIGVRDEARMLGGLGICGRPFCCGSFMGEFQPVSTKMAKTQSLSLNPAKISGCCGRLMCCLRYEQPAYEELVKTVPKNGAFVETPDGYGNVAQVNILRQTVRVKLDGFGDDSFRQYDADEVAVVPGGRPKDGSEPPHVLVVKPKKPKEEPDSDWELPEVILNSQAEPLNAPSLKDHHSRKGSGAAERQEPNSSRPPRQNKPRKKNSYPPKGDRQNQPSRQNQGQNTSSNAGQGQDRSRSQKGKSYKSPQSGRPQPGQAQQGQQGQQGQNPSQGQGQGQGQRPRNSKPYYKKRPYKPRPKPQEGDGAPKHED